MNTTRRLFIICATLCVSSAVYASTAFAATYTVNVSDNTLLGNANADPVGDGVCGTGTDTANDCSLREAIQSANFSPEADTIILPADTITIQLAGDDDMNNTGDFDILVDQDITITGQGVGYSVINGNDIDRIFQITGSGSALTLQALTVTNGDATGGSMTQGGAIFSAGTLTLSGVEVSNNKGSDGGALSLMQAATISNSEISDNTATNTGGAIKTSSTLTLSESVISGNSATANSGAIYTDGTALVLDRTVVTANTTDGQAGGIYIQSGTLTMDDSTVSSNTAAVEAGGLMLSDGVSAIIRTSVLRDNSGANGGAIQTRCGTTTVVNSYLVGNSASQQGGAVYGSCTSIGLVGTGTVELLFSTIADNTAVFSGPGLQAVSSDDDSIAFTAKAVILSNNTIDSVDTNCAVSGTGTIASLGYSIDSGSSCAFSATGDLADTDPGLSEAGFVDLGGYAESIALTSTSPAKDIVPSEECLDETAEALTVDARAYTRPENTLCDSGAYELDQTLPVVTLTGEAEVSVECTADYTDEGATALDNWDGELTTEGDASGVDTSTLDTYLVTYSARDADGNVGSSDRSVSVVDTEDPVTTLVGEAAVDVIQNGSYTELGATGADGCEGELTPAVTGEVDATTPGAYVLTYTAEDSSGNRHAVERTVTVLADSDHDGVAFGTDDNDDVPDGAGIDSMSGVEHGSIVVTLTDTSEQTYSIFPAYTGSADTVVLQHGSTGYALVLHPNGKKIALVNAYSGEVIQRITLSKKAKFSQHSIKNLDVRHDDSLDIVVTSKKKGKVHVSLLTLNSETGEMLKKDTITLTGQKKVAVSKTKAPKHKIALRNKAGRTVATLRVNASYRLSNVPQ